MNAEQTVIEKIRKLLALAEGNQNQHERESAMHFAMELLAKHNLTTSEVQGAAVETSISEVEGDFRLEPWVRIILSAASTLYYTAVYISPRYDYWRRTYRDVPVFVGTADNIAVTIEVASWLINSVRLESNRAYKTPYERRSFRVGAADKLFERAVDLIEAEQTPRGETTGTSLMVIRNKLEQANKEHLSRLNLRRPQSRTTYVEPQAYDHGEAFGSKVKLGLQSSGTTGTTQRLTCGGSLK
jgi:Protein of unknown function (DUF2786)